MIDIDYKPKYLPQISAPYTEIVNELDRDNVKYKKIKINPENIKPTQGIVFLDKIKDESKDYVWLSKDLKLLDGHHRLGSSLSYNKPINAIVIMLPFMEAIRELNKIQDIYDFKSKYENKSDINTDIFDFIRDEFLYNKDENTYGLGGNRKVYGYRNKPINKNSKSGNFFSLQPIKGYNKYEIEFDNLLDTDDMEIVIEKNPVHDLANYWFKGLDFDFIANKNDINKDMLINRCVSELAKKYGFDGIKYGDIILQIIK